ncbi:MAG: hypothetical protein A2139_13640 [Desulfobacca sp. RBG_16_60_12]|nr:MAG: hypothetical protein A2139_13640 [Desulfobacca sp. RBG_16_60_12]
MSPANQCIVKTLELAELMLRVAEEGDAARKDVGCGVLYGVLRDSGYRIRKLAEAEREAHSKKGR